MPDRVDRTEAPPHELRAKAHSRRARGLPWIGRLGIGRLGLLIGLPLIVGCGPGGGGDEPPPEASVSAADRAAARAELEELVELCGALDPLLMSDEEDAILAQREVLRSRFRRAGLAHALAAKALFEELPSDEELARAVMLEIAAHGRPAALADRLVEIVRRYDPELGLFVRTEAARILSETAPEVAERALRDLLTRPPNATLPPAEILLRHWSEAAATIDALDATFLGEIATDFQRAPDLRYAAITLLGQVDDPRSRQALEVVLVESGSDGYVRRKAAQALANLLPPDELCPILLRVADRETSDEFLLFLASQIERLCP